MKKLLRACFIFLCLLLLAQSGVALTAARDALSLWWTQVLPALLPFFICMDMLKSAVRSPLPLYLLCALSGAPSGARYAACEENEARRTDVCAALNVAGPMFVCGCVCTGMLGRPALALPILLAQYAACALFLCLCRPLPRLPPAPQEKSPLALLSDATGASMQAVLHIGGTILFFKVLLALCAALYRALALPALPGALAALLSGIVEMVNGVAAMPPALPPRESAALCAFLFSFGGICILAQSLRFAELRPLRYLFRKLLQGGLAAGLAYLLTPLFCRDAAVFSGFDPSLFARNARAAGIIGLLCALCLSVFALFAVLLGRKKTAPKGGR